MFVIFLLARVSPAEEEVPKPPQGVELLFPVDDGAATKDKEKDTRAEKETKRQAALLKKLKAIENGGDVNAADKKGQTALMQAAAANNRLAVCWLVAKGANAALKNKKGKTARDLSTSIAIRELLRLAADEKKPLTEEEKLRYHVDDKPTKEELQQSLCFALPYVEDVVNLIKMGAKPTAWDVDGTPILEPMKEGEDSSLDEQAAPESIAWLTRKGVDFTKRGKDGKWTGSQHLPPAALRLLLAFGVKPDLQKDDPLVCLQAALEGNDIPGIRAALAKDPKLATVWAEGAYRRYLLRNVHTGAAMKTFIECGLQKAPINMLYCDNYGSNSTEALDALLNAGFPLIREGVSDKFGEMSFLLKYMSKYHCKGLFSRLISAGVDPEESFTLCSAVWENNLQAVREVLAAGAKLPGKRNPFSYLNFFNVPQEGGSGGGSRLPDIFPTRGKAQLSSWRTECEYSLGIYDIIDTLVKAGCPVPDSLPLKLMISFMPPSQFKQCPDLPPAMVDLFASPEKILRFSLKSCGNKVAKDALINKELFVHIYAPCGYYFTPDEQADFSVAQLACIATLFLDAGADPTATDNEGRTALMLAGSTDASLAKRIMDAGVKPTVKDKYGETALHTARNVKTAQALLDAGASVQDAEKEVKILDAVIRQDDNADVPELCRFWKEHGAHFDPDFAEHLLAVLTSTHQDLPIFRAPARFSVDTYLKILEFLADGTDLASYRTPKTKRSFLHSTVKSDHRGRIEWVQALLKAGVNVNARDKDGKTPLMYAYSNEFIKFLIKNGADVNAQDDEGNTYLMQIILSTRYYRQDACRLLLDSGAKTDIKNKDGKTALQLARENKLDDVVKLLEGRGVKE